jgi:hypothetical protein
MREHNVGATVLKELLVIDDKTILTSAGYCSQEKCEKNKMLHWFGWFQWVDREYISRGKWIAGTRVISLRFFDEAV